MKKEKDIIPKYVEEILNKLESSGYKAYLVGGCVRDQMLGRAPKDWDIAVSAYPEDVCKLFNKTEKSGARYGTVTVLTESGTAELTSFRADGVYSDNRRPNSVQYVTTIEEDLSRRDFTVNAMAMSADGKLIDPYGGKADIQNRTIRCVGEPEKRFREDALRILRGIRFSAELSFSVEESTRTAMYVCSELAGMLSAERVCSELERTLMSSNPQNTAEIVKAGLITNYTKGLKEVNAQVFDRLRMLPCNRQVRWSGFYAALLCAGLSLSASDFCKTLRLDRKTTHMCTLGEELQFLYDQLAIKRLIALHGAEPVRCAAAADFIKTGSNALRLTEAVIQSAQCLSLRELAVSGDDLISLGFRPGKNLGMILNHLLEHVLGNPNDNTREKLLEIANAAVKSTMC